MSNDHTDKQTKNRAKTKKSIYLKVVKINLVGICAAAKQSVLARI